MKCVKYWPNTQTLLGPYQIRMERQNTSRRYILRHIKIKKVVVYFIYLLTILCEIFEKKNSQWLLHRNTYEECGLLVVFGVDVNISTLCFCTFVCPSMTFDTKY